MKREEELKEIKPLEWNKGQRNGSHVAHGIGIMYAIDADYDFCVLAKCEGSATLKSVHNCAHDAKAAAQADYDARVRSALLPTPKPEAAPVAWQRRHKHPKWDDWSGWDEGRQPKEDYSGLVWEERPLYAHPPKPEPAGWETEAEWELEMRCANITENTPFAEVSKLINDLWQQYCLAAEPKPEATEGGAHEKASGDTIMKADVEKMIRDWQAECSDHPALHNQGNVLLDRLKALKPSLAMNDFLTGMDCLAAEVGG